MASEMVYLTGRGQWLKVTENNKDTKEEYHGEGGAYTLDLFLEPSEYEKLSATGSLVTGRPQDDGTILVKLKRRHSNNIEAFGGPPQVVDVDKQPWDGRPIGNDSVIEVAVTVYDTKTKRKGTRVEGIRVIELVELPPLEDAGPKLPF